MMQTRHVMKSTPESALPYVREEIDRKLIRKDDEGTQAERDEPSLLCD